MKTRLVLQIMFSSEKNEIMHPFLATILTLAFLAATYFIFSLILLGSWNYVLPRLITSITGTTVYTNINYVTAMVFAILVFVLFGQHVIMNATAWMFRLLSGTTLGVVDYSADVVRETASRVSRASRSGGYKANEQYETSNRAW